MEGGKKTSPSGGWMRVQHEPGDQTEHDGQTEMKGDRAQQTRHTTSLNKTRTTTRTEVRVDLSGAVGANK